MGGALSVPGSIRFPVVKKKNASYGAKSLSNTRPSFVTMTSNPVCPPNLPQDSFGEWRFVYSFYHVVFVA